MLRKFWFGQRVSSDTAVQRNYYTVDFAGEPNIDAQIWLTLFSPGATYSGGAVTAIGSVMAAFKSYRFINSRGEPEFKELTNWEANVRVERCIQLTAAFHLRLAWAKAEGMIYYWN